MQYLNYHENLQRGTDDFPIEFYHLTLEHPRYHMSIHWHVEFEFVRVITGNLLLTINEQDVQMSAGTVAFVPSGFLHSYTPEDDCIYDCIVLDTGMLTNKSDSCRKFIRKVMNHEIEVQMYYDSDFHDICQTVWTLFDALAYKAEGYELIVQGALYQFFGIAISKNYQADISSHTPRSLKRIKQIKQALEFIEASYTQPLTLKELSASAQMSPKYFCQFFQEMTHRTPIDYLNYYRIERACHLLSTSNQSITEVAYNTGFNDLSYFIKIFKRYKGITPKQYVRS